MVFTDLNMPDITGIEMTRSVRVIDNKDELPVVMVTTQNDANDNEAAIAAGVNGILYKPFTKEQTGATLKKFFIGQDIWAE